MKIDLCKLLGVEEGEEFKLSNSDLTHRINNNKLEVLYEGLWGYTAIAFNKVATSEITKLPKKKEFTDDELCILRNIDKRYKWVARDKRNTLYVFKKDEPFTTGTVWNNYSGGYARFPYDDIFKSISWEDEEPIYIDDYVKRGGIDE